MISNGYAKTSGDVSTFNRTEGEIPSYSSGSSTVSSAGSGGNNLMLLLIAATFVGGVAYLAGRSS